MPSEGNWGRTEPQDSQAGQGCARNDASLQVWGKIHGDHGLLLSRSCSCGPGTTKRKGLQTTLLCTQRNIAICTQEKMTTCIVRALLGTQNLTKKIKKTWFKLSQRSHRRNKCETLVWAYTEGWGPTQNLWHVVLMKWCRKCWWRGGLYWHIRAEGR